MTATHQLPTYRVYHIGPHPYAFIGRLSIEELQAYNAWLKSQGFVFDGRSWVYSIN